ncbi:MAG TPA: hypothetical protein VFS08_07215 [Gemmatimonadaceae bacterium]|nr:hypothetical protein [Gemmatimonadaceae bacterium]
MPPRRPLLRLWLALPLSLLLAACGSDLAEQQLQVAGARPVGGSPAAADPGADGQTPADSSAVVTADADGDVATDSAVTAPPGDGTSAVVADTARPAPARSDVIAPTVAPGRSRRDSLGMVRAIRAGRRQDGFPATTGALPGALLPKTRIVAFYGNPLSKRMGVLGEYEVDEMLRRLDVEVARWRKADPATPVKPALHLIAVVAQGGPGRDGKYRLRMDSTLIEKVYGWAKRKDALLFLDVQVGWSTLPEELPRLAPFLSRPDVHLGIDPEFSMHGSRTGIVPGKKIGTFDAKDVNYAIRMLSELTAKKGLPPKVLVVHRFTQGMVTNAEQIRLDPRVQVVMDMDGWGPPWLKFDSYTDYIVAEPVQFTGFKLFFHNDTKKGSGLLTPAELVQLVPAPLYIQYQ